jgi:hypothetical protein
LRQKWHDVLRIASPATAFAVVTAAERQNIRGDRRQHVA